MTYSQAREYLWKIKRLDMDINTKMQELEKLEKQKTSLQSFQVTERVSTSHENNSNKVVDNIVDLQAEINQEVDSLVDLKRMARAEVLQMDDERFRSLLLNYYINNQTLEQCAVIMNYSEAHVYAMHHIALKAFAHHKEK